MNKFKSKRKIRAVCLMSFVQISLHRNPRHWLCICQNLRHCPQTVSGFLVGATSLWTKFYRTETQPTSNVTWRLRVRCRLLSHWQRSNWQFQTTNVTLLNCRSNVANNNTCNAMVVATALQLRVRFKISIIPYNVALNHMIIGSSSRYEKALDSQ